MDLTRPVQYREVNLNTVTESPSGIVGCLLSYANISPPTVRQFTEPVALHSQLDIATQWYGERTIELHGTVYDTTRPGTFTRWASLENTFYPPAPYILDPTSFGYAALSYYIPLEGGGAQEVYLMVRSSGLRTNFIRAQMGGNDSSPLAIPWTVKLVARDPVVYSGEPS